jgi:xylan 1,4-beta-xylosidase
VTELAGRRYRLEHFRIDETHSNILSAWDAIGRPDWPDAGGWQKLRSADHLEAIGSPKVLDVRNGALTDAFALPMPAASLLRLQRQD